MPPIPDSYYTTCCPPAFFDARCGKCGRFFGWVGTAADRPPCPRCGASEDAATKSDAAEVDAFRRFLKARKETRDAADR